VSKSIKDWLAEGEQIYNGALDEYQHLETQLMELEQKLALKREEVNVIAEKLGKSPIEASRRLSAEIVERGQPNSVPNSPNTIARALTGRGFGR
jgi:N-dimethylarginine dimethylaminohydrolase